MDGQATLDSSRRRLGRGLNALIGFGGYREQTPIEESPQNEISIDLIERNPFQPRVDFDNQAMNELVDSIRQHGVLQPLLVRPHQGGYQLIAGERRWIAARRAGLTTVPCRVLPLSDQELCEVSLEENIKRQDLNVLEKASAFHDYLERFGCTIEELARRLSMDRSTVSNFLRLLELPDSVKVLLRGGQITAGHARALLCLNESQQIQLAERIATEGWSVRRTEEEVRALVQKATISVDKEEPAKSSPTESGQTPSHHLISLQDQLREVLQAKVEIKLKGKQAGKIVIEFHSSEDFERLLDILRKAA